VTTVETGVVSYISAPMAQAGVPVLYVSTYLTSFILVRSTFTFNT
jgi:hypothetical protein